MGILSWLIVGLLAGWLASLMMGSGYGLVGDVILGVIGALLGGFLARRIFGIADPVSGINFLSIVVAFVGSVIIIGISRLISRPRMA